MVLFLLNIFAVFRRLLSEKWIFSVVETCMLRQKYYMFLVYLTFCFMKQRDILWNLHHTGC